MPHIHEKIDFVAGVYIVYKDKVLLRKHDKYYIWLHPGGHVELNEDPVQTAIREAKEEVGLDIEIVPTQEILNIETQKIKHIITPAYMNSHKISDTHTHIDMIYFAKSKSNKIQENIQSEKSDEIKWFTKEEIKNINKDITETVRYYALKALELLSKKQN